MIKDVFRATLKSLVLEMAVEEFSAPNGLSAKILEVSNRMGHGVNIEDAILNGHKSHKALPAPKDAVESRPANPRKGIDKRAPGWRQLKKDPVDTQQWMRDLLLFAVRNGGVLNFNTYTHEGYRADEHGGLKVSETRFRPAVAYLRNGLGLLTPTVDGVAALTPTGRSIAEELERNPKLFIGKGGRNQYSPPPPKGEKKPITQQRTASIKQVPVKDHILEFARKHKGELVTKDYMPTFTHSYGRDAGKRTGSIYGAIKSMTDKGILQKIETGHYRLTKGASA